MRKSLALLCVLLLAGGSQAGEPNRGDGIIRMVSQGPAFPPPAFQAFCARELRLCGSAGGTKSIKLTDARIAELNAVNLGVNRTIREQEDRYSAGTADDWRLPSDVGDCEDFAILKKHELMKRGWPASVLLLTVATSGGQGHVVLAVRTDQGDLVLDNRTNSIRDWKRTPYQYFARQSQSRHGKWDRIGQPSGQTVAVSAF